MVDTGLTSSTDMVIINTFKLFDSPTRFDHDNYMTVIILVFCLGSFGEFLAFVSLPNGKNLTVL